jgi:hypothetical protein
MTPRIDPNGYHQTKNVNRWCSVTVRWTLLLLVSYNSSITGRLTDNLFFESRLSSLVAVISASSHVWEAYRWLQKGLDVSVLTTDYTDFLYGGIFRDRPVGNAGRIEFGV